MLWSTRYVSCISALWAFPILSQPTTGTGFVPRGVAAGEAIARRACAPAAPDVSKSSIIADVCNQTLANDFDLCSEQLTVSIQKSAANICAQYSGLFTDCLMANQNDSTACPDALLGYRDCEVYTLQAYAYCGCYYTLPKSIVDCANQQLQSQPQDAAMIPTTTNMSSTAIPSSPRILASDVTADQEPTSSATEEPTTPASSPDTLTSSDPRILANAVTANQEPTPATSEEPTTPAPSPDPLTSPDPRIPSAPFETLHTAWSPIAAPSTSSELSTTTTTVVVTSTYTSTFTPAASYYTTTIISTAISTIYNTCADIGSGGVRISATTPALTPTATTTAVIVSAGQNTTGTAETIIIPGDDASSSSSSSFEEEQQTASSLQEETSTFTFTSTFFSTTSPSSPSPPPSSPQSQSQPITAPTPLPTSSTAILPPLPSSSSAATMVPMRNTSSSVVACKGCRRGRRSRVFL